MKKNAFTLTEIMIAISIIGILLTISTVNVLKSIQENRLKQAETELQFITAAVLQMAWDTGQWPNGAIRTNPGSTEIWNLNSLSSGLIGTNNATFTEWKGPYIDKLPDDPWGKPYFFDPDYKTNGINRIVVGSFGPNKVGRNRYDKDDIVVLLDD